MADLKISQLTSATTPLTGAEIAPLVQSGTTKKSTVQNLTKGRIVEMSGVDATPFIIYRPNSAKNIADSVTTAFLKLEKTGGANGPFGNIEFFYFLSDTNQNTYAGRKLYRIVNTTGLTLLNLIATEGTAGVDPTITLTQNSSKSVNFNVNADTVNATYDWLYSVRFLGFDTDGGQQDNQSYTFTAL